MASSKDGAPLPRVQNFKVSAALTSKRMGNRPGGMQLRLSLTVVMRDSLDRPPKSCRAASVGRTLSIHALHWPQVHKVLGKGSYGKVYKVQRNSDDNFYALKASGSGGAVCMGSAWVDEAGGL